MTYPQTYLYEILVRGRPDGSLYAHQITSTIFAEGVERAGDAVQLDPAQVSRILGDTFPDLAVRLADAYQKISDLEDQVAALKEPESSATVAVNSD